MVVNDNSKLGVHPCHCSSIYAEHASTSGSRERVMLVNWVLGGWLTAKIGSNMLGNDFAALRGG